MMEPLRSRASQLVVTGALALVMALGCTGEHEPGLGPRDSTPEPRDTTPALAALIVSNPQVTAAPVDGASLLSGSASTGVVYASLPPGTFPTGYWMVIGNRRSGAQDTVLLVRGGVDPFPVPALAGDTLDISIALLGQNAVLQFIKVVPPRVPPVIVRTDPPAGKRDVPLNSVIILIFSEPIKPATLTATSVQLTSGGGPVAGTLGFADTLDLIVTFTPAGPLVSGADYALRLTPAIEDLDGDPLAVPVTVGFTTQSSASAVTDTYGRLTPHSEPGSYSRYVFRNDSTFELQYETATWGNFAFAGRYWLSGSTITFAFDGWNTAGPWEATGTLLGDSLVVAYNIVMGLDGFDDGVYGRFEGPEPPRGGGGRIAFASNRDGSYYIYVANPDGSNLIQLAEGVQPAWSGDGTRIAYVRPAGIGGLQGIHVMNADGSGQVWLGNGSTPSWSPDGSQIVFSVDTAIMVMNADGSNQRELINLHFPGIPSGSTQIWRPAWSPDGQSIVFDSRGGSAPMVLGERQVFVMDADGSNPRQLSLDGWSKYNPTWSPDGSHVLVQTYDLVLGGLWGYDHVLASYDVSTGVREIQYRPQGFQMQRLGEGPNSSPDGRWLTFSQLLTWGPGSGYRILLLEPATGIQHPFVAPPVNPVFLKYWDTDPVWSRN